MRPTHFFAAASACLLMAGCNTTATAPKAPAIARSPVTPAGFKLPEGTGCSGEIARYRAIMDNDKRAGHVNDKIYDVIQQEIIGAETACTADSSGQSLALLHASKVRHGYPG